jgi:glycosyltransferase involved in cell wall biosynthesis
VAYLERLTGAVAITLVSFEKEPPDPLLRHHLESRGIRWRPLRYHRHPPVASTAWDVAAGARAISRELQRAPNAILHARSYVPAEMVLRTRRARRSPLLFDMRGFWVDERLERGDWRHGPVYRYARAREQRFFARADAIVTLTDASTDAIRRWTAPRNVPVEVIPTCAPVERFAGTAPGPTGPRLVWMGSVGKLYRLDLASRLRDASGLPLTVLTRQVEEARAQVGSNATVTYVPPDSLPAALHTGDVGLCLYGPGFSRIACAPTRFAEFLAAGMPVAVTPEVGDLARIVEQDDIGCVLRDEDDSSLQETGRRLAAMASAPEVQARCRSVAARRFEMDDGAQRYAALYRLLAARGHGSSSP